VAQVSTLKIEQHFFYGLNHALLSVLAERFVLTVKAEIHVVCVLKQWWPIRLIGPMHVGRR